MSSNDPYQMACPEMTLGRHEDKEPAQGRMKHKQNLGITEHIAQSCLEGEREVAKPCKSYGLWTLGTGRGRAGGGRAGGSILDYG